MLKAASLSFIFFISRFNPNNFFFVYVVGPNRMRVCGPRARIQKRKKTRSETFSPKAPTTFCLRPLFSLYKLGFKWDGDYVYSRMYGFGWVSVGSGGTGRSKRGTSKWMCHGGVPFFCFLGRFPVTRLSHSNYSANVRSKSFRRAPKSAFGFRV